MEAVESVQTPSRMIVTVRGRQIVCDQPTDHGGEDLGMSPTELLAGGLAACCAYCAAQYLYQRQMNIAGLSAKVIAETVSNPARLGAFHLLVNSPPIGERPRDPLLRALKTCVAHNTPTHAPVMEVSLNEATMESSTHHDS